jgi:hypothetical protein
MCSLLPFFSAAVIAAAACCLWRRRRARRPVSGKAAAALAEMLEEGAAGKDLDKALPLARSHNLDSAKALSLASASDGGSGVQAAGRHGGAAEAPAGPLAAGVLSPKGRRELGPSDSALERYPPGLQPGGGGSETETPEAASSLGTASLAAAGQVTAAAAPAEESQEVPMLASLTGTAATEVPASDGSRSLKSDRCGLGRLLPGRSAGSGFAVQLVSR